MFVLVLFYTTLEPIFYIANLYLYKIKILPKRRYYLKGILHHDSPSSKGHTSPPQAGTPDGPGILSGV